MFYVNNEQVKGIFLNGRNYNYLSYGFGKIIPEDRNSVQLNLNLAYKYLNQYRIEFGTVKDGYENALVSPRFDKPDSNGVFHSPFTYYYNGNIISTKEVNVLVSNAHWALLNASVYNDININGNITYFATNTDFLGHNVNVFPEGEDEPIYKARLNQPILSNCTNFSFDIQTRFSKQDGYPSVDNCNNFSGNFKYVGNQDREYPGFRGFLYECKDGVFNIDCTNMHGGGSAANITNYYNFIGIQSCSNIKLNITGSSWQVWPHDHSFSSNCNINTYNVISGFSYMNDCNFNVVLPKDSKPEMDSGFGFLNNANNCNYNLNALDSNLFNYRSVGYVPFFDDLNNCNLSLLVNNTVSFDHSFGNNLRNCNIIFDNIKTSLATTGGWMYLNNCNITGNVVNSAYADGAFIYNSNSINVNLHFEGTTFSTVLSGCSDIKGKIGLGGNTAITHCSNMNILYVNNGGTWINNISNSYIRANNTLLSIHRVNDTNIYSDNGNVRIIELDNCNNLTLSGLTFKLVSSNMWFFDVYNSYIKLGTVAPEYNAWRVENCDIDGFPRSFAYVNVCTFRPFNIKEVGLRNSEIGTWNNMWPHRTIAGIRSRDNLTYCRIEASTFINSGDTSGGDNLQTSLENHYNNVAVATSSENSRLTISCNDLRLDLQPLPMPGLPSQFVVAGFVDSSISANNIAPLGVTGIYNAGAKVGTNTRIYCSGYCATPFYSDGISYSSRNQPVVLLNDYNVTNREMYRLSGGFYRFGTLSGTPYLNINNGACVFINNTRLSSVNVDNALLFIGNNVSLTGDKFVTNGGLIINRENWGPHSGEAWIYLGREHLCWNIWDSGPWGSSKLLDFCVWI